METRRLGRTGLEVTRLGFGLAGIATGRERSKDVSESGRVLEEALDGGINFLDTAAGYGSTEELIGKAIAHRRDEYVLATKFGLVSRASVGAKGAFSAATIEESIDRSLRRTKTDHLDILQLHSPEPLLDLLTLDRDVIVEAMVRAREAGKTRFLGYSGDNEAAQWAVNSGVFDTLQTTFNLVDQQARKCLFAEARARDIGIIIKRTLAMGMWGKGQGTPTYGNYPHVAYLERARLMGKSGPVSGTTDDSIALAMGFVFAHPEVDTGLVGTTNLAHLRSNMELAESGVSITSEAVDELYRRFDKFDWPQVT